jgi:hypothetical protein
MDFQETWDRVQQAIGRDCPHCLLDVAHPECVPFCELEHAQQLALHKELQDKYNLIDNEINSLTDQRNNIESFLSWAEDYFE